MDRSRSVSGDGEQGSCWQHAIWGEFGTGGVSGVCINIGSLSVGRCQRADVPRRMKTLHFGLSLGFRSVIAQPFREVVVAASIDAPCGDVRCGFGAFLEAVAIAAARVDFVFVFHRSRGSCFSAMQIVSLCAPPWHTFIISMISIPYFLPIPQLFQPKLRTIACGVRI